MVQSLPPDDPRLVWEGAVSLQRTAEWVMPWRLPHERLELFPPKGLQERASMPAGVRLVFRSDTRSIGGRVDSHPESSPLDLCCDGRVVGSVPLANLDRFQFDDLPAGEKLIELWLPQFGVFRLRSLELSEGATASPFEDNRPRWITYGSSITHCRQAASPTQTWPAIVARRRQLNLTCLGYGGNCHLEPMIARLIRDLPADFLSMCVGINVQGASSLGPRTFRSAIIGFVQIVREKHPSTPLVVMSPVCSPPRETTPNIVGFDLPTMRQEVAAAVDALRSQGDGQVHYLDGREILGPEHAHLLPDQVHPNPEGYQLMGRHFFEKVVTRYFP